MERKEDDHHRLLKLFDSFWFYNPIFFHKPKPLLHPPPPPPPPPVKLPELKIKGSHRRSLSDEQIQLSSSSGVSDSHAKLQTILSGKEGVVSEDTKVEIKKVAGRFKERRMRRRGSSKSLSDLEFEELKGFMDLGFTFSDAETDPRLMSIVPALRRRSTCDENKDAINSDNDSHGDNEEEEEEEQQEGIVRPYLSEAWEVEEEKRLKNWMIPVPMDGEDMKDSLRSWARAVASTVR
ncbi:hypothetical protein J5N97_026016 [Dioscorea zingiberensis]|uniref:Uncharacterized protein n=1 Tax=Dioscorea zingiberensis TaxID=325984 RepID=A0A9D5H691_9LILI|nr:hypothetical protein J5N97_026016 [Dioscorea zingiberensis]